MHFEGDRRHRKERASCMESKFFETNRSVRALPSRSRLYPLAPIGVGTPWIESLTSYINRLAWAYRVSSKTLAIEQVLPHLIKPFYLQSDRYKQCGWYRSHSMSLNGATEIAKNWSGTLELLTARLDIHRMTCIPWTSGLPMAGLLCRTVRWCSACYDDWQQNSKPIYQPLLWVLQVMKICPHHRKQLEEQCPSCHMSQSVLTDKITQPGHCTQCNAWLGVLPGSDNSNDIDDEVFNWQVWVMNVVEELLQVSDSLGSALQWGRFRIGLISCIGAVGGVSRLAHLTDINPSRPSQWANGKLTPSFKSLLEFCYKLNISPLQIIAVDQSALKEMLQVKRTGQILHFEKQAHGSGDRAHALEILQEVLDGRVPPRSVSQITRETGVSRNTLLYHFPQECRGVSALYMAASSEKAKQRATCACDEVRRVTRALSDQAIPPSYWLVKARLSDPNLMRRPEVRETWRATRRELGFEGC
jgi:transcriptional regulator with XRE-family HTH domain